MVTTKRRAFVKQASLFLAAVHLDPWAGLGEMASTDTVVAQTAAGDVRGRLVEGVHVFKGIPYGGTTAGKNRFRPPVTPTPWTGTRDAFSWGATAPQMLGDGGARLDDPPQSEDCLVLNVSRRP